MFGLIALAAAAAATPAPAKPVAQRAAECAGLAKNAPDKAMDFAKAWVAEDGAFAARQCLGLAQVALGQWAAAAGSFEAAARDAQLRGDQMAAPLWMQAGNAALAGDEPVRAKNALDRAIALKTMSDEMQGEAHLDRARADVAANDLDGARVDLAEATRLVPRDPLGWLLTANLARKRGDKPGALAAIREAARLAPDDASVAYEAGNIAQSNGQMDDAKAAWTRAAQLAPTSDAGQAAALALKGGG